MDLKQKKNEYPQKDELKRTLEHLTLISNKINLGFLEFDKKINIEEKRYILGQLDSLLLEFQEEFKIVQNQYCISSQDNKRIYLQKFRQFFRIYKTICETISQKRNIYNILNRGLSINEESFNIDLGEENKHLLDFSQKNTILNSARLVVKKTDSFIKDLEEEMKTKNIINMDDSGYKNYLHFQRVKQNLIRQNNIYNIKLVAIIVIILSIVISFLYYVIIDNFDDLVKFKD